MTLHCIEIASKWNYFNVYEEISGMLVYQIMPIWNAHKYIMNKSEVYTASLTNDYFAFASPYISKLILKPSHCYANALTDIFKYMRLYYKDNKTSVNTIITNYQKHS